MKAIVLESPGRFGHIELPEAAAPGPGRRWSGPSRRRLRHGPACVPRAATLLAIPHPGPRAGRRGPGRRRRVASVRAGDRCALRPTLAAARATPAGGTRQLLHGARSPGRARRWRDARAARGAGREPPPLRDADAGPAGARGAALDRRARGPERRPSQASVRWWWVRGPSAWRSPRSWSLRASGRVVADLSPKRRAFAEAGPVSAPSRPARSRPRRSGLLRRRAAHAGAGCDRQPRVHDGRLRPRRPRRPARLRGPVLGRRHVPRPRLPPA